MVVVDHFGYDVAGDERWPWAAKRVEPTAVLGSDGLDAGGDEGDGQYREAPCEGA